VVLIFFLNIYQIEKHHPSPPHLRPSDWRGLTFDDLVVTLFFGSVKVHLLAYLGHHWILAHTTFSLFTDVPSGDVTGAKCRLDRYFSLIVVFTVPINSAKICDHLLCLTLA
jgi:hypothetical protein